MGREDRNLKLQISNCALKSAATIQIVGLILILSSPHAIGQVTGIAKTKHNLSVTGPGAIKATTETQICVFCHTPHGAFYAFPSIESTGLTSDEFAERCINEARVAVVPGSAFGLGGEGHIRASYATAYGKIERALERIEEFIGRL